MKKRLISVFVFALAVSAGAAFVLYQLIASKVQVGASTKSATVKVLVAARDLETGNLIAERDVEEQDYLSIPAGALGKKEDVIGRGVTAPVHAGSPFYAASLAAPGAGAGFASTIPKGMRAFAVHVNEVIGVAGFAVAGMKIDLLVSGVPPGGAEGLGAVTRTLMQNVQVLSAGQNYQKDAEGKPVMVAVLNLLVTPAQAEILNLAADQKIQFVLRNPADTEVVQTPGAATANLFDGGTYHIAAPSIAKGATLPAGRVSRPSDQSAGASATKSNPKPLAEKRSQDVAIIDKPPALSDVVVEVYSGSHKSEATFKEPAPSATGAAK